MHVNGSNATPVQVSGKPLAEFNIVNTESMWKKTEIRKAMPILLKIHSFLLSFCVEIQHTSHIVTMSHCQRTGCLEKEIFN